MKKSAEPVTAEALLARMNSDPEQRRRMEEREREAAERRQVYLQKLKSHRLVSCDRWVSVPALPWPSLMGSGQSTFQCYSGISLPPILIEFERASLARLLCLRHMLDGRRCSKRFAKSPAVLAMEGSGGWLWHSARPQPTLSCRTSSPCWRRRSMARTACPFQPKPIAATVIDDASGVFLYVRLRSDQLVPVCEPIVNALLTNAAGDERGSGTVTRYDAGSADLSQRRLEDRQSSISAADAAER